MRKYRITARFTQVIVIEGEGTAAEAKERAYDLSSGIVDEKEGEVSSFRELSPDVKYEIIDG